MKHVLLALCALLTACCAPRITPVSKLGAVATSDRSLYYYLPRADVSVQVEVTRTTKSPGDYLDYACLIEHLVPKSAIDGAVKSESVRYALGECAMKPVAGIDPGHIYRLDMPKGFMTKNNITIEYLPSGELKGGTLASENLTAKVVTQTVSSIVSIASAALGARSNKSSDTLGLAGMNKCLAQGKVPREALLAATQLEKLIGDRAKLLTTQAYGEPLENTKWRLEQVDHDIEVLLGRFIGITEKKTITLPFLLNPNDWNNGTEITLFELDAAAGVKRKAESDRVVWDGRFDEKGTATALKAVTIKWITDSSLDAVHSQINPKQGEKISKTMLAYRIPRNVQLALIHDGQTKAIKDVIIPQKGSLAFLPNLKSAEFALYEGTGGLAKLVGVSKSIDPDQIKAASDAIASGDTLFSKPDPTDVLIHDLEQQVKLKELQDKLNGVAVEDETDE